MGSLSKNTYLQDGKYIIKSRVGQETLFFTYYATQTTLNREVLIREFYMRDFCTRQDGSCDVEIKKDYAEQVEVFKVKFLSEAKSNAVGDAENDLQIFDVFEENNTAYYVFLAGENFTVEENVEVVTEPIQMDSVRGNCVAEDETVAIVTETEETKTTDLQYQSDNEETTPPADFWQRYWKVIAGCVLLAVLGFVCAMVSQNHISGNEEFLSEVEAIDSLDYIEEDTAYVDSIVYDNDMQGAVQATNHSKAEFDKYIAECNNFYEKAKSNPHKPSTVQNILDARYYYYDKANKINVALTGERLPANKEIDELTEQEYQYWISEAKKCGSAKSKYEQKRTCLKRARSLAFKHQNLLDNQIKWLDDQLAKRKRRR